MTEKQPKTCEEYVLNELYSTQNKIAVVSKELQETKEVLGIESALHKELFELITRVCSGGEIEENKNGMISLYLKGKYIGSFVLIKQFAFGHSTECICIIPARKALSFGFSSILFILSIKFLR